MHAAAGHQHGRIDAEAAQRPLPDCLQRRLEHEVGRQRVNRLDRRIAVDRFADEFLSHAVKANGLYEDKYPMVSSLARPLIADEVVKVVTTHYNQAASDSDGLEASFGELDPVKTKRGLEESQKLISTPETEKNGLFTISEELQQQTVDSLAAAGWEVSAEDLFDTSIIDEIYEEQPELKKYLP